MNIYAASSWKNPYHDSVVSLLRYNGHKVFDYRQPAPNKPGFKWPKELQPWDSLNRINYKRIADNRECQEAFNTDYTALRSCDALVLTLPSGNSSHLELGAAIGLGKLTIIFVSNDPVIPDLMYLAAHHIVDSNEALIALLSTYHPLTSGLYVDVSGNKPLSPSAFTGF